MKTLENKRVLRGIVAAFIVVIFLQLVLMARANSPTFDEPAQIFGGYLQWKHGAFLLNPPLIPTGNPSRARS